MNDQDAANARRDVRDRQQEERLKHDQALSAHQIQAIAKNHADNLAQIKRDVDLRKWAVDQACGLIGAAFEAEVTPIGGDVVSLSRSIHAFLVEGAEKAE